MRFFVSSALLFGSMLFMPLHAQTRVLIPDNPEAYARDWRYDDMLKHKSHVQDEDERFIRRTIESQVPHHWFVSVRAAQLKPKFEKIAPRTTAYDALTATTQKIDFSKTPQEIEASFGYTGERWTWGLLAVRPRTIRYNSEPVLTTTLTHAWDSKVGRLISLMYLEYDVIDWSRFALFVEGGLGPNFYFERSTRSSGATGTKKHTRYGLAGRGGFGIKAQIWKAWSVQLGHATYLLTPTLMGPVEQTQRLRMRADTVGMSGSYLALIYRL